VNTNAKWHARAARLTPAGVHSNARIVGSDIVHTHGLGPWLVDVEGQRHVDYMLGRGPAFLGHAPDQINTAVAAAARKGLMLGSGTTLEVEAAERVLSVIEWADQVRFNASGTEAVQSAFRLARATTGRPFVVQFEGLYHGWLDNVSLLPGDDPTTAVPATEGQMRTSGSSTLLLPWNDSMALDRAFAEHGHQIAGVITEPAHIFGASLAAPGFLSRIRKLTTDHGAALILDEVVTGFRLRPGTAAALFDVTPDIGVYGKAMGSGWPVAAVAATAAFFDGVAADRVRLSGTYNGNSAGMAAVSATVDATADGTVHEAAGLWGQDLMAALASEARRHGITLTCEGFPTAFWLVFEGVNRATSDALAERLGLVLRDHLVVQYHHTWLTSAAHDDEALQVTLERFDAALDDLHPALDQAIGEVTSRDRP
jgi:glutamate-1-semialdehyde 2,1-aminomutase